MIVSLLLSCARPAPTPAAAADPAEVAPPAASGGPVAVVFAPARVQVATATDGLRACTRSDDPIAGLVLDCPRGKVVLQTIATGATADGAAAAVIPQLDDVRRLPFDLRFEAQLGGQAVQGLLLDAPSGGAAWLMWDPRSPKAQAAACLDRTPNVQLDAWCQVAVESVWGPRATGPAAP